jgi:hypothetical protein
VQTNIVGTVWLNHLVCLSASGIACPSRLDLLVFAISLSVWPRGTLVALYGVFATESSSDSRSDDSSESGSDESLKSDGESPSPRKYPTRPRPLVGLADYFRARAPR